MLNFKKFNFPISGVTSYKELQQTQHIESHTHVVSLEEIPVERNLAQLTGWTEGAPVWRLVRQREIEGEVDILDIDYLIKEIVPELPKHRAEDSIFDYLENDLGLAISYAQKEITVEEVTPEIEEMMDLHGDRYVVVVRGLVHLEDTRCFEYTESIHRLDKFRFVEFARRRKV